jgi:hypothetical protein
MYGARSPVHSGEVTDLPYFAWNRTEAERIQAEIRKSSRSSDAELDQEHEQPSELPRASRVIPALHDA